MTVREACVIGEICIMFRRRYLYAKFKSQRSAGFKMIFMTLEVAWRGVENNGTCWIL